MSTNASGAQHLVTLKVTFLKQPHSGVAVAMNAGGVWFDSLDLAGAIQRELAGVGHEAIPQEKRFVKHRKMMFVPFSQIEWILADGTF
jgi:hypothetical protein